jgi:hypothetical protein
LDVTPENVSDSREKSKTQRFFLQQQSAEKFAQRTRKLEEANGFRAQIN